MDASIRLMRAALIPATAAVLLAAQPAYALNCGDTITSSLTLTTDLVCSSAVVFAVEIHADGITLDCKGHSIAATVLHTGAGIELFDSIGVTIRNCVVTGWNVGIEVYLSSDAKLSGNTATDNNGAGIAVVSSSGITVHGNAASGNGNGFHVDQSSSGNRLMGNASTGNNVGFGVFASSDNDLVNNTATDNLYGFWLASDATGNALRGNASDSNASIGFSDSSFGSGTAGTANTYKNNRCQGNVVADSSPAGLCK